MRRLARLDDVAVREPSLDAVESCRLERMGEHRHAEALAVGVEVRDVVAVMVRQQHVRDRQPKALDRLQDRLHGTARVDQHGVPTRTVADDVAVRQPPRQPSSAR